MSMTIAEAQRRYRERKAARFARMEAALNAIMCELDGRDSPVAIKIREMVEKGLRK